MRWPNESVLPRRDAETRRAVRDALRILRAGLDAVDPQRVTAAAVRATPRGWRLGVGKDRVTLPPATRFHVLAVGKAASAMARGFAQQAPPASMLVVAPERRGAPRGADVIVAGHPVPTPASFRAGRRALGLARRLRPGDALVLLVSGGASSLLEDPVVPAKDYRVAMRALVRAGLSIENLNAVRKHLSRVKGGRLAQEAAARGVAVVALLLSDVPSNRPDTIGSGLASPDESTFRDALRAVHRAGQPLPASVMRHLRAGAAGRISDTPKPGELPLARVMNALVASNETARIAMAAEARRLRYAVRHDPRPLRGEAWLAGQAFARALLRRRGPRSCLVAGGETTVRVRGPGMGGRNQEFALGAATVLRGSRAVVAAFGTDGVDGRSLNAGAVVDGRTLEVAARRGLDLEETFARSDSASFFARVGGALRTGPTGTNVADLVVGLRFD